MECAGADKTRDAERHFGHNLEVERGLSIFHETCHKPDIFSARRCFDAAGNIDSMRLHGSDSIGHIIGREASCEDDRITSKPLATHRYFAPIGCAARASEFRRGGSVEKQRVWQAACLFTFVQIPGEVVEGFDRRGPRTDNQNVWQLGDDFGRFVTVELNGVEVGRGDDGRDLARGVIHENADFGYVGGELARDLACDLRLDKT